MASKANRKRERERELEAQRQRTEANRRKREMAQRQNAAPYVLPYPVGAQTWADLPPDSKSTEPPTSPPVFSQCVVGYRVWNIDPLGRLRPKTCDVTPWVPGVNTARCERHHYDSIFPYYQFIRGTVSSATATTDVHGAPTEDCDCGLYAHFATHDLPTIEYDLDASQIYVVGAVAAWGTIQVHADGIRAEKMCVTALALTDSMPPEIRDLVERVAAKYRVSAVAYDLLQAEAEMHGMPLPEDARPTRRPDTGIYAGYTLLSGTKTPFVIYPTT